MKKLYEMHVSLISKKPQFADVVDLAPVFRLAILAHGKGKLMHLEKTAGFFATLHIPMPKLNAILAGEHRVLRRAAVTARVGVADRHRPVDRHHDRGVSHGGYGRGPRISSTNPSFSVRGRIPVSADLGDRACFGPGVFSLDAIIARMRGQKKSVIVTESVRFGLLSGGYFQLLFWRWREARSLEAAAGVPLPRKIQIGFQIVVLEMGEFGEN